MKRTTESLLPQRPYLFRAFYQWILDNELTPLIVVDVSFPGVDVPMEYVKAGKIVLNISPASIGHYQQNNDYIQFNARFNGVSKTLCIPYGAFEVIYARENGEGIVFPAESCYKNQENEGVALPEKAKPTFRVVK